MSDGSLEGRRLSRWPNIIDLLESGRRDDAMALLNTDITIAAARGPRSTAAAIEAATMLFEGDFEATTYFMSRPHPFLGLDTPAERAEQSEEGLQEVLDLIGRAAWGVYA